MKKFLWFVVLVILIFSFGCDQFRYAPTEIQKQNAWIHNRTVNMAADKAGMDNASDELKSLTKLSGRQSESFVSYFGVPKEIPSTASIGDVLSDSNYEDQCNCPEDCN